MQAVGQICSTSSMSQNLAQCQTLVKRAAEAGAKVSDFSFNCVSPSTCAFRFLTMRLNGSANVDVFHRLLFVARYRVHRDSDLQAVLLEQLL